MLILVTLTVWSKNYLVRS